MKMIGGPKHLSYEKKLRDLGVLSQKKRMFQGDIIVTFQYSKETYKKDGDQLFTWTDYVRIRGDDFKLKEGRFILDVRRKCFTRRMVRHWSRLPRKIVDAPFLEVFKTLGNQI